MKNQNILKVFYLLILLFFLNLNTIHSQCTVDTVRCTTFTSSGSGCPEISLTCNCIIGNDCFDEDAYISMSWEISGPNGFYESGQGCCSFPQYYPVEPNSTYTACITAVLHYECWGGGCGCSCQVLGNNDHINPIIWSRNSIGNTCDDGDNCTINDEINSDCECSGTFQDSDGDGVCDAEDQCPNGPDPGQGCDDGNNCTIDDLINSDCECFGTFQDTDGDGICDAEDQCPGFDDNLIGSSCDDSDDCTINDIYTQNCVCIGTFQDEDNDGVCDAEDQCPGFDDGLIGASCNDGDPCTINDIYYSNCLCVGVYSGDSDGDGVCDAIDLCPGFDDGLIGTLCDDGNNCTINDTVSINCICEGILTGDSDGDGVCDAIDYCPNGEILMTLESFRYKNFNLELFISGSSLPNKCFLTGINKIYLEAYTSDTNTNYFKMYNIPPGFYNLTLKNDNGCEYETTIELEPMDVALGLTHFQTVGFDDLKLTSYNFGNFDKFKIDVCADGQESFIKILYNNKNMDNINLLLHGDEEDDGIIKFVYNEAVNDTITGAVFEYISPTNLPGALGNRPVAIEIITESEQIYSLGTIQMVVHNPPLVLTHGIWDNGGSILFYVNNFLQTGYFDYNGMTIADWGSNSENHLEISQYVIPNSITRLLKIVRSQGIAVDEVDVAAHSAGGLLTRMYIQGSGYRYDINRFISMNTPHSGSQFADFILDPHSSGSNINLLLKLTHKLMKTPNCPDCGILEDLRVDGPFMDGSFNSQLNNLDKVPSHAITSTSNYFSGFLLGGNSQFHKLESYKKVLLAIVGQLDFHRYSLLFRGEQTDNTVPIGSQKGGLIGNATSLVPSVAHEKVFESTVYFNHLFNILKNSEKSSSYSTTGFYPKDYIYYPILLNNQRNEVNNFQTNENQLALNSNQNLKIKTPLNGSVYMPKDTVIIEFESSFEFTEAFSIINYDTLNSYLAYSDNKTNKHVFIADSLLGKRFCLVSTFDSISNIIAYDTVSFYVTDNTDFDNDGILNDSDNCQSMYNPTQEDFDSDGIGDICDKDDDNDGVIDEDDLCLGPEPGSACNDGNVLTYNDQISITCQCLGSTDPNFCLGINKYIGDFCDDQDSCTQNDIVTSNCECKGDYIDFDQDGFCFSDDCNDNDPNVNSIQVEIPYNGIDDDCNLSTLDDDLDFDGYLKADDCDDTNQYINPNAVEIVNNNIDENCDGVILIIDNDSDGFNSDFDCDDNNALIFPGTAELCDGLDNNCNGNIDEDFEYLLYFVDLDSDGFGSFDTIGIYCKQPSKSAIVSGDCDDNNPNIFPGAVEIPNNGVDEDCDGEDFISSTSDEMFSPVIIFPNPATDEVFLRLQNIDKWETNFYSFDGKLMLKSSNNTKINVSDLTSGIFILEVVDRSKGLRYYKKLVLQK